MTRTTRPISWIRAALKEFETFPQGAVDLFGGLDDRRRGWKGRYCKADAWPGIGCVRVSTAVPGRCVSHDLCGATRRRNLGNPCVPKEIDAGYQDAETRD